MKNGMKLGSSEVTHNKNSFAFDNQFLDYEEDPDDHSQYDKSEPHQDHQQGYFHHQLLQDSILKEGDKKPIQNKRLNNLSSQMDQLSVSILEMKQKYNDLDMQQMLFRKRNQKKQSEIKQFLQEKKQQKRKQEKKMQKIREKEAKNLEQSIVLEEESKKKVVKSRIEEELKKINKQKQMREIEKIKKMAEDRKVEEMYHRLNDKEKKKFHLRKMEEDRKKKREIQENNRKYLMKRREQYKPLNAEELDDHENKYKQMLEELNNAKVQKKQKQYEKILQSNEKLGQLFRGQSHDYVQDEIEERRQKKEEPHEKYKKMKNYQEYVREKFIPKTHQIHNKSADIQRKGSSLSHREVKRYKYLQGMSYGEVIENRPIAKSYGEKRKIGNGYMAYMKSLPKKKKSEHPQQFSSNDLELVNSKLNSIVKIKKQTVPLYEGKKRKNLDVKISDKPTRHELKMVIDQLKVKDQSAKMHEKVMKHENQGFDSRTEKSRNINEQIVNNIERKLNLLAKL